ncbi:MAG: hypothetical protein KJT03_09020, partial [Verrucomicrobiae bacterium]|nr:hypothetical protein [Verrucomicrobiae bacterium]
MSLACFALLSTKGCSLSAIELFRLNGEFYTPTPGTETKSWNILVDSGAMFEQITVELDITPGDWWDKNPDGLHNLFWLTRGDTWRHNTIGYVNLFGEGRLELKQLTNLDLPKAITRAAMTPYYGTTGKTFHLRYTFDCRSGKVSSEISEEGQVQASLTMDATTGRIIIPDGYLRIWIGLEGHYNECPTYGWTYANLRIQAKPAKPALFVHKQNPRYFDDGSGKAIALCGVNNGWELQDNGWSTPFVLDWEKYLDYLKSYHHNYIRLWRVESTIGREPTDVLTTPMPYLRTGPGTAHDGEPKFDLDRFNPDYFDRMRERCLDARERGIFVCVMLFEKHSTFFQR